MALLYPVLLAALAATRAVLATFDIDTTPNAVAICYSVWHSLTLAAANPPPDITDIENGIGGFGPQSAFHYWGRPDGGYYGGGDRGVLDRHFAQMSDAGIDFVVVDATNCAVCIGWGSCVLGF